MAYEVDVSKRKLVKGTPPSRYGRTVAENNPLFDDYKAGLVEKDWRCYVGLSTVENVTVENPQTHEKKKISELSAYLRMLRRAASTLGKGLDTSQQTGEKPKTVDLWWKARDKSTPKVTEEAV